MWAPVLVVAWLGFSPAHWVVEVWDGAQRLHQWVTLRLMGFEQGPPPVTVPDSAPVAALSEAGVQRDPQTVTMAQGPSTQQDDQENDAPAAVVSTGAPGQSDADF